MLLSGLYAPGGSWSRRLVGLIFEGLSFGTLEVPAVAPATGYISFFTLALYVAGLALLAPPRDQADAPRAMVRVED
jgi:hypothetical protein